MERTTGDSALRTLLDSVPEFAESYQYPMTIVMDSFADFVADRLRGGAGQRELRPYFEFVENLAESDDLDVRNLVVVCFLEAAPWGQLGGAQLLGPATRELARGADPDLIDTTML